MGKGNVKPMTWEKSRNICDFFFTYLYIEMSKLSIEKGSAGRHQRQAANMDLLGPDLVLCPPH